MNTASRKLSLACSGLLAFCIAVAHASSVDVWMLDSGAIDPNNYFGVTVANGMIGFKSSPHPFQTASVLMQGVLERGPENWDVLVPMFNVAQMAVAIDGIGITEARQVTDLHQRLDLKQGALTSTFDYDSKASVRYTWYALRQLPFTALVDVTVTAQKPIEITATIAPEAPTGSRDFESLERSFKDGNTPAVPLKMVTATARSSSGQLLLATSHAFLLDGAASDSEVHHASDEKGKDRISLRKHLKAGETYRFAAIGTTMTSAQTSNPRNDVDRLTILAALVGRERLLGQHRRAWEELWQSNILIEGDAEMQREVHAMLYHLYAFTREGAPLSPSPMGLSGKEYHGHVFWDTETWMFPVLVALQPAIAAALLEYRYERLGAARRNAFAHGYRGAMFPWESAASGFEDTPVTQHCCLSGVMQDHITADIAIAAWQYFQVTQDRTWLRERGWPLLRETADFWVSRITRNGPGRYDIRNVVGAAENQKNVDNEAYTNAAARENLRAATAAAKVLGLKPDPDWAHVRENIPILRFANGLVQGTSLYRDDRRTLPEVLFLAYPLRTMTDRAEIERHLAAAETSLQPGLAGSVVMTLNAQLGRPDQAYDLFKAGHRALQRPPFGVLAEHITSRDVYFATGAGGLLQAILYGFGGLEMTDKGLVQRPRKLPAAWKSLTLTGIGPHKRSYTIRADSHASRE